MIKRTIVFLLLVILVNCNLIKIKAMENIELNATSAILIELNTGKVLYEYNSDIKRNPASMTKIMSAYLVLEAIENKTLSFDDEITASANAASKGGSQIYLAEGEIMKAYDLFKSMLIASANDATVALAEEVSSNETNFVDKMNAMAKVLKCENTNFVNSTGLPMDNHYTTAYDLSLIARDLLLKYEEVILPITSTYDDYIRTNTNNPFWLVNTNKLIKNGLIDGLKTGWTNDAGYCLCATTTRNNMRLISVVMGCTSINNRNQDTMTLIEYGYRNYEMQIISPKGSIVNSSYNFLTSPEQIDIVTSTEVIRIIDKNSKPGIITQKILINYSRLENGEINNVGILQIFENNQLLYEIELEVKSSTHKKTYKELLIYLLRLII